MDCHFSLNAPCLPPKILHDYFFFHFSWVVQSSQEKLKTMLMQEFGGQSRCITGDVEVAHGPGTKINTVRWVSLGVRDRAHPVLFSAADQPK